MKQRTKHIQNNRGSATFEALPLLVIFVMLIGYTLGLYGAVHSATLNSIAARTYAFETFRNRTNLTYHRESSQTIHNQKIGFRYHAVVTNNTSEQNFPADTQPLTIGRQPTNTEMRLQSQTDSDVHNNQIFELGIRNQKIRVAPIWIMVAYGMCLNATCGAPEPK